VPLTGNVLQVAWQRARTKVGRNDLRLHDLRHTGLTLAAATGATTVELMHRGTLVVSSRDALSARDQRSRSNYR